MPLTPPPGVRSICWSCKYWDWRIEMCKGGAADWVNECRNPAEYQPGDEVMECEGYEKENG